MVHGSSRVEVKEFSKAEEIKGKLSFQQLEDKFMHSVLENDKKTIEKGKLLSEAVSYGIGNFSPDMMFEQLVNNYSITRQIYGDSLIRILSGHDAGYLKRNIAVPEFQKELKQAIAKKIDELKEDGFLDKEGTVSEKGIEMASLVLYFQELDNIIPSGLAGEKLHKRHSHYGDAEDFLSYKKGMRYRDISIKKSIKLALRRNHKILDIKDLKAVTRQSRGHATIIYALDASGSMKGKKIDSCKKAGIALAYKAIDNRDKVGIIIFGSEIKIAIEPTLDFTAILKAIASVSASRETDMVSTISKAIEIFPDEGITKHLVLITDAMPTKGESPEKDTIEKAFAARNHGITISLVGINLDEKGKKFAEKIVEVGQGRLYIVKNIDEIDKIVLEDYYLYN